MTYENHLRSPVCHDKYQLLERPLNDHNANRDNIRPSLGKPVEVYDDGEMRPSMHKKTKSSVSLKSLISSDKAKPLKTSSQQSEDGTKLRRPKSSTGLSALLSRSKTPKAPKEPKPNSKSPLKDKENRTPPPTAGMLYPPIWAQFATQQTPEHRTPTTNPAKGRVEIEREIALYTPKEYSPSKQRDFYEFQPTLSRNPETKSQPRSDIISSHATKASVDTLVSGTRNQTGTGSEQTCPVRVGDSTKEKTKENHRPTHEKDLESIKTQPDADRGLAEVSNGVAASAAAKVKRGSRVMAAVAAFNGTRDGVREIQPLRPSPPELDVKAIETEFETLLVSWLSFDMSGRTRLI